MPRIADYGATVEFPERWVILDGASRQHLYVHLPPTSSESGRMPRPPRPELVPDIRPAIKPGRCWGVCHREAPVQDVLPFISAALPEEFLPTTGLLLRQFFVHLGGLLEIALIGIDTERGSR